MHLIKNRAAKDKESGKKWRFVGLRWQEQTKTYRLSTLDFCANETASRQET
jgi:hypothetical protein